MIDRRVIADALEASPFVPFAIHAFPDCFHEVPTAGHAHLSPPALRGQCIIIWNEVADELYEHKLVALRDVTGIRFQGNRQAEA